MLALEVQVRDSGQRRAHCHGLGRSPAASLCAPLEPARVGLPFRV